MKRLVSPGALQSGKLLTGKLCWDYQAFIEFPGLEGHACGLL